MENKWSLKLSRYFDIFLVTILTHLIAGVLYYFAYFAIGFASSFLMFLPYTVRRWINCYVAFILVMFIIWKLSKEYGYKLQSQNKFVLKEQIVGSCIGSLLDLILYFLMTSFSSLEKVFIYAHSYSAFPFLPIRGYWGFDSEIELMRFGMFGALPFIVAVKVWGTKCGKDSYSEHQKYIALVAEQKALGISNKAQGRSWRETVGNSDSDWADFLKNKK